MRRLLLLLVSALAGCTYGAPPAISTSASSVAADATVTTVDVDLTLDPDATLAAELAGGYRPLTVTVAVGSYVRFMNSDGFTHTVTSIAGTTFPASSPFDASALVPHGDRLSTGFSAGQLVSGATSAPILADEPGTYLYGCFYHYAAPMRAEIIVQ
jgi:plastocyanin